MERIEKIERSQKCDERCWYCLNISCMNRMPKSMSESEIKQFLSKLENNLKKLTKPRDSNES